VLGGTLRWALDQTRLAPADSSDARIPLGGTPGYAVLDLRAGWAFERWLQVNIVLENVLDTAYRVHGSSINGPGRGLLARIEGGF
nr:TonB-dependent receptor [Myxococcota bacterium]